MFLILNYWFQIGSSLGQRGIVQCGYFISGFSARNRYLYFGNAVLTLCLVFIIYLKS